MTRTAEPTRRPAAVLAILSVAIGCHDDPTAPPARARGDMSAAALAVPVAPLALPMHGASSGAAVDINDSGVAVGHVSRAGTTHVRWHPDGRMDTVPLLNVAGIGNDGSVAGAAAPCTAGRWSPTAGVVAMPPLRPNGCTSATAISPGGHLVAGYGDESYGPPNFILQDAFLWLPGAGVGSARKTGGLYGWRYAAANDVSGNAIVVGTLTQTPSFVTRAFWWSPGGAIGLLGRDGSSALAVNAAGTIVGTQDGRAVRLDRHSQAVTELMPGVPASSARSINDKGEIVITAGNDSWLLRGSTLVPLASLGGCCAAAWAVNERSQVAGYATDATGAMRPVIWDVDAPPPLKAGAGGPYAGVEGASLAVAGAATGAGPSATYAWSFGDGSTATGPSAAHAYADDGSYPVTLTVTDGARQATAGTTATIANATPTLDVAPGGTAHSGEAFTVRARFDDPGVNDAPWRWTLLDHDSTVLARGEAMAAPDAIRVPVTFRRAGTYWLSLTLVDKDGGGTGGLARLDVLRLPVPMAVAPSSPRAARRGKGLLTVTLFATPAVDPARIDVATVRLAGLAPAARGSGRPRAALEDVNGDGVPELVLKFDREDVRDALTGSGGPLVLHADLVDGRQVEGRLRWPSLAAGQ